MAPKKNAREPTSTAPAAAQASPAAAAAPTTAPAAALAAAIPSTTGSTTWDKVLVNIYNHYVDKTPQRIKLLDIFLVFLALVGALQFLYCILAGNYVRYPGWLTYG